MNKTAQYVISRGLPYQIGKFNDDLSAGELCQINWCTGLIVEMRSRLNFMKTQLFVHRRTSDVRGDRYRHERAMLLPIPFAIATTRIASPFRMWIF
ncbi:MAG: hypothetical protein ACRC7D_20435 [Aeromonas popoffii]|uniref:hypothetical protein n=1 Tax=Aeromonas popoffii TaxID=70856 RepID=UPI003F2A842D